MVNQGRFCFVAIALIPPDSCADTVAGVAALASTLITLMGKLLFKVSGMLKKSVMGNEKEGGVLPFGANGGYIRDMLG